MLFACLCLEGVIINTRIDEIHGQELDSLS